MKFKNEAVLSELIGVVEFGVYSMKGFSSDSF